MEWAGEVDGCMIVVIAAIGVIWVVITIILFIIISFFCIGCWVHMRH